MSKNKLFLKEKIIAWRASKEEHAMAEEAARVISAKERKNVSVSELNRRYMIQVFENIVNSEAA